MSNSVTDRQIKELILGESKNYSDPFFSNTPAHYFIMDKALPYHKNNTYTVVPHLSDDWHCLSFFESHHATVLLNLRQLSTSKKKPIIFNCNLTVYLILKLESWEKVRKSKFIKKKLIYRKGKMLTFSLSIELWEMRKAVETSIPTTTPDQDLPIRHSTPFSN